MNNIITLPAALTAEFTKPPVFSDESDLYFDVWERPAYFKGVAAYYEDPNHKHIVRQWHDEPISIGLVGKNYKLLKNKEPISELISDHDNQMSPFELSLLMGMMAHPVSNFTTVLSTSSVQMEWSQDHMI